MAPRGSSNTPAGRKRSSPAAAKKDAAAASPKKKIPQDDPTDVYRDPQHAAVEHRYQYVHNPQDHDVRKRQILEKYGDQVRKLMVIEPRTKWDVFLLVALALLSSVLFSDASWPVFLGTAYICGTMMTHALFLAIHEVTHYTVFKTPWLNSLLAMIANLPIVFPYAMMFRDYHSDHHRYLGWDGMDTDLPIPLG